MYFWAGQVWTCLFLFEPDRSGHAYTLGAGQVQKRFTLPFDWAGLDLPIPLGLSRSGLVYTPGDAQVSRSELSFTPGAGQIWTCQYSWGKRGLT